MSLLRMRRGFIWLAIGVFACAALAPSAMRTLSAWSGTTDWWAEICTAAGLKTAGGDAQSRLPAPQAPAATQDCPLCLPHQGQTPIPARPATTPVPEAGGATRYLLFFIGAAPASYSGTSAQPRAPPVSV
jgi:hypothetical protein